MRNLCKDSMAGCLQEVLHHLLHEDPNNVMIHFGRLSRRFCWVALLDSLNFKLLTNMTTVTSSWIALDFHLHLPRSSSCVCIMHRIPTRLWHSAGHVAVESGSNRVLNYVQGICSAAARPAVLWAKARPAASPCCLAISGILRSLAHCQDSLAKTPGNELMISIYQINLPHLALACFANSSSPHRCRQVLNHFATSTAKQELKQVAEAAVLASRSLKEAQDAPRGAI